MKKFITICLSLLCALGSHAQQRSAVTGVIYDSVQKQGLLGAVVELIQASDTTQRKQAVTSIGGKYTINDVKPQQYTLRAIYLGYQTAEMPLTVKGAKFTADTLVMRQGIESESGGQGGAGAAHVAKRRHDNL
ncbi:MAG: carboxypeptidase-like regulatory domain-containing protein [Alistipes putredinis]|nr:MAG: carboxypeptidase-like regulatory domain-containing protein [Alistipes putredinis]